MSWMKDVLQPIALLLVGGGIGHWSGKRAKIDEIRIAKIHELVQAIATSFQIVHEINEGAAHWYRTNFQAMPSINAGVARFRELSQTLYVDRATAIERLTQEKTKLAELLKQARIYLPASLCGDIETYLATCAFAWSDVWPLFDTYVEGLFENLLDDQKSNTRTKLAKSIMSQLEKSSR